MSYEIRVFPLTNPPERKSCYNIMIYSGKIIYGQVYCPGWSLFIWLDNLIQIKLLDNIGIIIS